MQKYIKATAAATLLAFGMSSVGPLQAAPIPSSTVKPAGISQSDVQLASGKRWNKRGRGYRSHHRRHGRHYRGRGSNAGVALGAFGMVLGLSALAAASQANRYRGPAYYGSPEPWTRDWYRYCSSKYRSFNPNTGYFTAYSGQKVFCR